MLFALEFNGSVRLEARAERLTSEAGAVLLREVEERLGLARWLGEELEDTRDEKRITHSLRELVRTHLLLLAQGWRDQDDADALRKDAALRLAVSDRRSTGPLKPEEGRPEGLASQPTLSRLTAMLAQEGNREVLRKALVWLTGRRLRAQFRKGGGAGPCLPLRTREGNDMTVRWRNYVWKVPQPVDPIALEKLETDWGVELPKEYKQIAPLHHGMMPQPSVFELDQGGNVFTCLLTLTSGEHEWVYSITAAHKLTHQYVPAGIFPFGTTPGGEYLCFDYRDTPPGQPRVVLVTTEMEIYDIADSFREFLEGLHEPRE